MYRDFPSGKMTKCCEFLVLILFIGVRSFDLKPEHVQFIGRDIVGNLLYDGKSDQPYTYRGISCGLSGNGRVDLYRHDIERQTKDPIVIVVTVDDTRDVEKAIVNSLNGRNSIVFHVILHIGEASKGPDPYGGPEWSIIEDVQQVVVWVNNNAAKLGGDHSRVSIFGMGPHGSRLVSLLSLPEENRFLFQRGVIEYGEHTLFSVDGIFFKIVEKDENFGMIPAPKSLLVGINRGIEDAAEVAGTVDFLEAFSNHGTRITIFERSDDTFSLSDDIANRLSLWFDYSEHIEVSDSIFPKLDLSSWRNGIQLLENSYNSWSVATKDSLFEPRASDIEAFPEKNISLGTLRGRHLKRGDYEADGYYHIPFAMPASRFQHSSINDVPWEGILDARYILRYKDCTQNVFVDFGHEDCLNLHIFVPTNVNQDLAENPIPVMVFMHGGSFGVGTAGGFAIPGQIDNALYDGTVMADYGKVIIVSVNYRLGALGFMNDGDLSVEALDGNYGIRDMIVALKWVKKYIREFGGDPNAVTLFGESAGSAGSGVLAVSPMIEGLIQRNIQESGSSVSFFAVDFNPGPLAKKVTTELGCRSADYTETKKCLLKRNEFDFVGLKWTRIAVSWRPTIDDEFLPEDPAILLTRNLTLDNLIGFNSDEIYIFAAAVSTKFLSNTPLTMEDIQLLRPVLDEVVLKYPDRQQYINYIIAHAALQWKMDLTTQAAKESIVRASTDFVFAAPSIRQSRLRANTGSTSSTYLYNFNIITKIPVYADWAYNSHAFEIPYVFGEPLRRTQYDPVYNETADILSRQMISYWTNFAKTGDPNTPMTEAISGLTWNEFTAEDEQYMSLNFHMKPENLQRDYKTHDIELWNYLIPTLFELDDASCEGANAEDHSKIARQSKTFHGRQRSYRVKGEVTKYSRTFLNDTTCNLQDDLVRNTTSGCVLGSTSNIDGTEVQTYLGVPYAEPPTGQSRFQASIPVSSWGSQVLEANDFMPDCPYNSSLEGQSEDCLYLYIFRPNTMATLPVMVWIHPDMAMGSGGAMYDGKRVAAAGNVILVTLNYRIGALGFLSTGWSTDASGNYGLLDQNLALLWVKNNIGNFGGDPTKITVFGDGDSSVAIGYHTVTEMNGEQLFTSVIHQSGVGQLDRNLPYDDAANAEYLAQQLSCPTATNTEMIQCLKSKSVEEIMTNSGSFEPQIVVDGVFLQDQPYAMYENNSGYEYKYLISYTSGEGSDIYDDVITSVSDRESFKAYIKSDIVLDNEYSNPARVQALVEYEYMDFPDDTLSSDQQFQKAVMDMRGDKMVVAESMAFANITNRRLQLIGLRRTYVCVLTSPVDDAYPAWIGAPSGSFERLFWNLIDEASPETENMASRVLSYWSTFATYGRPIGVNTEDAWLRYEINEGHYGELDSGSEFALLRQYPRPQYTSLWNVLIPMVDLPFPCETTPTLPIPEVTMPNGGKIRGYSERIDDGRAYEVFRGLPFAEPPTGNKRFMDSVLRGDFVSSDGVYSATLKKPRCLQTVNGIRGNQADEDCLYLDIWRPANVADSSPVLFWICNGGQSVVGPNGQRTDDTSCDVDGRMLALDGNVLFVKVQYRVGILGFASTESSAIPGNAGISDLKNALQWVYNNIENFGGSKEKVTIGGNGFGATLAMILGGLTESIDGGTVQNIIAQDGNILSPWAYTPNPLEDINALASRSECSGDIEAIVACLRSMNVTNLLTLAGNVGSTFPFGIFVKNENPTVGDKLKTFKDMSLGNYEGSTIGSLLEWLLTKPVMMGFNGGAGYQFTVEAYPEIQTVFRRRPIQVSFIENIIDNDIYLANFGQTFNAYESLAFKEYYIPWGATDDGAEIKRSAIHYHTDAGFTRPMYDMALSRLKQPEAQSTFLYNYQEATGKRRARRWLDFGSDFGEEISEIFPSLGNPETSVLGATIRQYWGTFVTRNTPNGLNSPLSRWRAYSTDGKDTMIFKSGFTRVVSGYRDQANDVWQAVLEVPTVEPAATTTPLHHHNVTTMSSTTVPKVVTTKKPCPPIVSCPEKPVMGGGIGLELDPDQADVAIETLFGISLSLACLLIISIAVQCLKSRKSSKDTDSNDSFMLSESAKEKRNEAYHKERDDEEGSAL